MGIWVFIRLFLVLFCIFLVFQIKNKKSHTQAEEGLEQWTYCLHESGTNRGRSYKLGGWMTECERGKWGPVELLRAEPTWGVKLTSGQQDSHREPPKPSSSWTLRSFFQESNSRVLVRKWPLWLSVTRFFTPIKRLKYTIGLWECPQNFRFPTAAWPAITKGRLTMSSSGHRVYQPQQVNMSQLFKTPE